jgi:hypothetical protein
MVAGNPSFNEILSTTLRKWLETKFVDNVFKARVLAYTLMKSGNIRKISGGASIVIPVLDGKNGTVMTYTDDEELRILRQKGMTAAEYKWAQAAVSITITGIEEAKNNGESAIIDLLQGKISQAEESLTDFFNKVFFGDHATAPNVSAMDSTVAWNGFGDLLNPAAAVGPWIGGITPVAVGPDEPITGYDAPGTATASANVGAIYPAETAVQPGTLNPGRGVVPGGFWLPYSATAQPRPSPDNPAGVSAWRHAYNSVSVGNDQPNLILTDQAGFESYEDSLVQNIRYTNTDLADSGFQNLLFKGAPVTYDADVKPAHRVFFLNMRYLELVAHSDVWMKSTPFVRPNNRDARTAQILSYGQLVCSNRARNGIVDMSAT